MKVYIAKFHMHQRQYESFVERKIVRRKKKSMYTVELIIRTVSFLIKESSRRDAHGGAAAASL
jgi:hypothetical protein